MKGMLEICGGISFRGVFMSLLKGITFIKTHTTGGDDMRRTGMVASECTQPTQSECVTSTRLCMPGINMRLGIHDYK